MTSRRWCWTLNNWTPIELVVLEHAIDLIESRITYYCWSEEEGREGTPHLQGYAEFSSAVRLSHVKRFIGARIHGERARGTGSENRTYCSKDDNPTFVEFGRIRPDNNEGRRTDLEAIRTMIQDGESDRAIAERHFGSWIRYRQGFEAYRALINPPVTKAHFELDSFPAEWKWPLTAIEDKSIILWGEPGIGKTQFALAWVGRALLVSHLDDLRNFNKNIHDGIVFDDMSFTHMPVSAQIHLTDFDLDRSIHIRYGVARIPSGTKKIFTTNVPDGAIFDLSPSFGVRRRVSVHRLMNRLPGQ